MLSYSTREMRRIGDQSTVGPPFAHGAEKRDTPTNPGAEAELTLPPPASSAPPPPSLLSSASGTRWSERAQPRPDTANAPARTMGGASGRAERVISIAPDARVAEGDIIEPHRHRVVEVKPAKSEVGGHGGRWSAPSPLVAYALRARAVEAQARGCLSAPIEPELDMAVGLVDVKLDADPCVCARHRAQHGSLWIHVG